MISEGAANLGYITTHLLRVKDTLYIWEVNFDFRECFMQIDTVLYGVGLGRDGMKMELVGSL